MSAIPKGLTSGEVEAHVSIGGARRSTAATGPIGAALRSAGWLVAAQAVATGLQFPVSILIARHLGAEGYGRWGFALSFVSLLAVFADFGFSTLVIRDLARDWQGRRPYLGNLLLTKGALGALLFALVALLQPLLTDDPTVRALIYVMMGQVLVFSFAQVLWAVFRVAERTYLETAVRAGQSLALLGATLLLIRADAGPVPLAAGFLAATSLGCLAAGGLAARLAGTVSLRPDVAFCRRLLSEAWPIGLAMGMTSIYHSLDMVLLGLFGHRQAVGWYAAAYVFVNASALVVAALRGAFLPHQARLAAGPAAERSALLGAYGRLSAALSLPVAMGGVLAAGPLLGLLFGEEYRPATVALQILSVNAGLMFVSSFFGSQLLATDRQRRYLLGVGAGAVLNTALNLVLIPLYSLEGAAVATVLSEGLVAAWMFWQVRREVGMTLFQMFWPSASASALMALCLAPLLVIAPVPAAVTLAAGAYLAAITLLGGLPVQAFRRWARQPAAA